MNTGRFPRLYGHGVPCVNAVKTNPAPTTSPPHNAPDTARRVPTFSYEKHFDANMNSGRFPRLYGHGVPCAASAQAWRVESYNDIYNGFCHYSFNGSTSCVMKFSRHRIKDFRGIGKKKLRNRQQEFCCNPTNYYLCRRRPQRRDPVKGYAGGSADIMKMRLLDALSWLSETSQLSYLSQE